MRFVVIDFEATCDEPYNPDPQEIIEFPAVVVDPGGPSDAAEFHTFVRPVAHPRLTPFCAKLTGITQNAVDAAPTFPEVLSHFDAWLQTTGGDDALMVTCGDWDLGSLLPRQCAQHRLPVPAWADRWANLKHLFAWHFPHATDRAGLPEIASALGVLMAGRLHSGIDDARNIAAVLWRMLEMGVAVTNTAVWRCLGCGAENILRDRSCFRCGKSSVVLKPGDWVCSRCGCGNFAARDKCFDCGTRRPGGGSSPPVALKRGDWLCPKCGEHNFARRADCYKCRAPR
jgi:inhibitor of KinA sporulation pathway (predicted exonuclease)